LHTTVWVSVASLWEIAIKHALSRERMPVSAKAALDYFRDSGYEILPVRPEHAVAVEDLPNHHRDPFDRLLMAQALVEPMRFVTHDALLARYSHDMVLEV
jgi:PIN domain nuclease of toxin-antitoxin system